MAQLHDLEIFREQRGLSKSGLNRSPGRDCLVICVRCARVDGTVDLAGEDEYGRVLEVCV